ncbi:MAG TPA: transcriptional regulator [Bacteroidia bacterium]|jgi:hypothetical protein|nr:transcriptional regulator [Bacteroidia bacterium]
METFLLDKDITVFYIQALSFPDGVMGAHQQLHAAIPRTANRRYFGLSRPEGKQGITYKAAAEELLKGEGARLGFETLLLPKGTYKGMELKNFRTDVSAIGKTFAQLTSLPDIDPNAYCVELYLGENDVRCMVRMK